MTHYTQQLTTAIITSINKTYVVFTDVYVSGAVVTPWTRKKQECKLILYNKTTCYRVTCIIKGVATIEATEATASV